MDRDGRLGVWLPLGALGAVALGVILIPLRTLTSASNLSLVFIAFTIVVAELGGRLPALVTALMAAISLNFFLTEPYLSLNIDKPDDVIAFVALAGCGLIAAAFGTRRERLSESARRAMQEFDALRRVVEQVRTGDDPTNVLSGLRTAFGFRAMVLRDSSAHVLASVGDVPRGDSPVDISLDSFLPVREARVRFGAHGLRLPASGGRIRLADHDGLSLDVWEAEPWGLGPEQWRAFSIAVAVLGLRFTGDRRT